MPGQLQDRNSLRSVAGIPVRVQNDVSQVPVIFGSSSTALLQAEIGLRNMASAYCLVGTNSVFQ